MMTILSIFFPPSFPRDWRQSLVYDAWRSNNTATPPTPRRTRRQRPAWQAPSAGSCTHWNGLGLHQRSRAMSSRARCGRKSRGQTWRDMPRWMPWPRSRCRFPKDRPGCRPRHLHRRWNKSGPLSNRVKKWVKGEREGCHLPLWWSNWLSKKGATPPSKTHPEPRSSTCKRWRKRPP